MKEYWPMRYFVSVALFALTSHAAMASSIEVIDHDRTDNKSIINLRCGSCPPLKEKVTASQYVAPSLQSGVQKTEIRDVNGTKEMFRTEAWLGGSPVVYVSTAKTWMPAEDSGTTLAATKDGPEHAPDGIDFEATTTSISKPQPPVAASTVTKPDFSNFSLRLN
jgi:hypothetical protein